MKIRSLSFLALAVMALTASGQDITVASPDSRLAVKLSVDPQGTPTYAIEYDGATIIEPSPLGFQSNVGDFSRGMTLTGSESGKVDRSYVQDRIKQSHVKVDANTLTASYKNKDGQKMAIEWLVEDNDVAFRYLIPKQGETGSMLVEYETTGYRFPAGTTTFLTPQSDPMIGWKRTKPSYEEYYTVDAPMDTTSQYGHGYTFPALFKTPSGWALLTESGVDGYYCASRLSDYHDGLYTIAYPMPEENNGNGNSTPGIALPGKTPWRTITVGNSLAPIVETTIPWDLVEPLYTPSRPAAPGKGTWSWILWQDGSINYDDQIKFIDLAAELGYENCLLDNWWDTNIGREKVEELIKYAKSKGVNLCLWYSSSGHWNDIEQGPTRRMDRPIVRKQEMKWLQDNGVKTIKVDFFGGDKQETMRLYEDILSDAADHGIDVVFHGCTLPRGWERMYPNFVGAEAVLASENLVFGQEFCDLEAFHATLHPFIRNSVALMEYGGSPMSRRMHKKKDKGTIRRTGDAFELATAVLFQNPVQNFALVPNDLTDAPAEAIAFMKSVPTTWDETRYVDGYPGKFAVVARRHGDEWYIAGVNAEADSKKLQLDLSPYLTALSQATLYVDTDVENMKASPLNLKKGKATVEVPQNCGFVIRINQ